MRSAFRASSIRRAPAISMPPGSSTAIRPDARLPIAAGSAALPPASLSSRSDPARCCRWRKKRQRPALFEGLARIGAPDLVLRHPARRAVHFGTAPVAVAFADLDDDAGLDLGNERRARQRLAAPVAIDVVPPA